jgi:cation diffusion facilitator CzcD-associated flavoprotein CzcO
MRDSPPETEGENDNPQAFDPAVVERFDAIVIGAGIAGMYQLYRLRKLGLSVRVFETGTDVGGTWYWNRYPGARFDSESYSYGYSFSDELLKEWDWSEHFSAQPETLRYLNFVADKFDLRKDIRFSTRVVAATFDEAENSWEIATEDGARARARFLITAIGPLSAHTLPDIEGRDSFEGLACHTSRWPHEPVVFEDKRVGVIGTGATGVQVIQEVAKTAGQLTVFQLQPNFCAPLHNSPIDKATQAEIHASYPEIFDRCRGTLGGFIHALDPRSALDVPAEEREAIWEKLYSEPGFGIWMGNFADILVNEESNALMTEFISKKIRERVKDPAIAEKLVPKDHGFGTRRVPLETHYYEVYNQDNVELVDLNEDPIERITPQGIRTNDAEYELDILIYATGFDAITGAFDRIEIRGEGGKKLKDKWAEGPRTYLGLQAAGFPNFLTLVGPHNAATFCNIPRCIEQNVEWVTDLVGYMRDKNYTRIEATKEAEDAWTKHVYDVASLTLLSKTASWFTGANQNLPSKKQTFLAYAGGSPAYSAKCAEVASNDYEGFVLE